jgi:hypothetical protein
VTGRAADLLENRLQKIFERANQQATMHAWLSDRYGVWNLVVTISSLISSAVLLAFVFASDFVQRTTGLSADAYQWVTGLIALIFFCVTLVNLAWQPGGRSARHDQAVRHYTKAKYEIGHLLDSGSDSLDLESVRRLEELYLDDRDLPRIPEGKFLKLKRWHKLKVAVSQELDHDLSSIRHIKRRLKKGSERRSDRDQQLPEDRR